MKIYYKAIPDPYQYVLEDMEDGTSISCTVIFSDRKSVSIRIETDGSVKVRAPYTLSRLQINGFIEEKRKWISDKRKEAVSAARRNHPQLSPAQQKQADLLEKQFRKAAREYFPARVAYYHQFTGGNYGTISIRDQKSRWGSCSGRGTISFNYRLMLAPPKVLDYVVVHELCHLTYMNHQESFWHMVESVMPDYRIHRKWLKEHGQELSIEHYLFSFT